ncbi:hypothetical protein [Streptomyces sp. NRRL S-31]|uniref:hypothetical protein n=1 Tax=Streptomyces sp. NRRL S-31 TaxID=1463898 RepID=UPI0004CB0AE6|nr:hypothetical protein [Streptomyces sp. NRRL S-31]
MDAGEAAAGDRAASWSSSTAAAIRPTQQPVRRDGFAGWAPPFFLAASRATALGSGGFDRAGPSYEAMSGSWNAWWLNSRIAAVCLSDGRLDDSPGLAARGRVAGADVILDAAADVPHLFQSFAGVLDEAGDALGRVALFLGQRMHAAGAAHTSVK